MDPHDVLPAHVERQRRLPAMRAHAEGSPITHKLIADVCADEYALGGRVTHG